MPLSLRSRKNPAPSLCFFPFFHSHGAKHRSPAGVVPSCSKALIGYQVCQPCPGAFPGNSADSADLLIWASYVLYGIAQADPGRKWRTGFFGLCDAIDLSPPSSCPVLPWSRGKIIESLPAPPCKLWPNLPPAGMRQNEFVMDS